MKRKINWGLILTIAACFLVLALLIAWLAGCAAKEPMPEPAPLPAGDVLDLEKAKIIYKEVFKTNWLATAFILCIAVGVLMITQRLKLGWGLAAMGGAGLYALTAYQYVATHPLIPAIVAGVGLVAGAGWLLWRLFVKDRATAEVVMGIQRWRNRSRRKSFEEANLKTALNETQSPSTKKIVKEIKERNGGSK